jgi:AraC-like DNA-binding protein
MGRVSRSTKAGCRARTWPTTRHVTLDVHERFVHFIGQPPMQYLAQWRMQVAARLLRDTKAKLVEVALGVGYESEAAFSRAFKRAVGVAPGAWRSGRRPAGGAEAVPP